MGGTLPAVYRVLVTQGNQLRVTIEREETEESSPALALFRETAQGLEQLSSTALRGATAQLSWKAERDDELILLVAGPTDRPPTGYALQLELGE